MNKRVKWGIIIVIGAGLIGGGIYSQLPKENEDCLLYTSDAADE